MWERHCFFPDIALTAPPCWKVQEQNLLEGHSLHDHRSVPNSTFAHSHHLTTGNCSADLVPCLMRTRSEIATQPLRTCFEDKIKKHSPAGSHKAKDKTQCDAYTSSLCLLNNKYASCKCHWIRMQLLLAVWMLNCRPYKTVRLFFLDIGLRILCCMHMRGHWYLTSFMSDMLLFPFKENLAKPMQCKEGWAVLETAIYTQNKQH